MSVETFAQFIFKRLRVPLFMGLLAAGPLCAGIYIFLEKESVDLLLSQYFTAKAKVKAVADRKERKERFLAKRKHADPYFLSTKLEAISFLGTEADELRSWLAHPAVSNKEPLKQRLKFLEGKSNHLAFQEDDIQISKLYKETVEKQHDFVELDEKDLKSLLTLIEEVPSEDVNVDLTPQLIISEFALHKKNTPLHGQVLEIKMDLFKREFLSP
jgi:hypothetical protein